MYSYYSKKKKNRLREIEFEKIEEIKKSFSFTYKQIADLLNVHQTQVNNYKKCGRLPAGRYYAMRDALLIACEDELREKRQQIMQLF